ncbi:MAG TPA: ribonuclease P protein component [Clostridia bacterium]|nr:ribonuclease P protein component [Clostridia bacterium]
MNKLRKSKEFKEIYSKGKSVGSRYIVLFYRKNRSDETRIGFTASKKVGNSVKRNRARRLMKEAYRHIEPSIMEGYDIVAIARVTVNEADYKGVKESFLKALQRAGIKKQVF